MAAEGKRPLWVKSKLVGYPEPPTPYMVEKTFTNIEWKNPLFLIAEPGTDFLWVVPQGGESDRPSRILRIPDHDDATTKEVVLEIKGRLIYAVAFHPSYKTNGLIYVFTSGELQKGEFGCRVAEYKVSRQAPFLADANGRLIIEWKSHGHDGGGVAFGKDRMLYITAGDGGEIGGRGEGEGVAGV